MEVWNSLVIARYLQQNFIPGAVPEGAVEVGCADDGEKLYMGRAMHGGAQTPGKLHPSHGCLYIPFGGAEVLLTEYEVLVSK